MEDFDWGPEQGYTINEMPTINTHSSVDHPDHYTWHPVAECHVITQEFSYNIGNAIAYLWRHDRKNGREDLEKAIMHIRFEMDRLYPSPSSSNS